MRGNIFEARGGRSGKYGVAIEMAIGERGVDVGCGLAKQQMKPGRWVDDGIYDKVHLVPATLLRCIISSTIALCLGYAKFHGYPCPDEWL